jgi:hypothetical protein
VSAVYETDEAIPPPVLFFLLERQGFSGLSGQIAEMLAMVHNQEGVSFRSRVNRTSRQGLGFWPVS